MFYNRCGGKASFSAQRVRPSYYPTYQPVSFGNVAWPTYTASSMQTYAQPQTAYAGFGAGLQQLINQSFRISMMQAQLNMLNSLTQAFRGSNSNKSEKVKTEETDR
jgi:hypothetical protein